MRDGGFDIREYIAKRAEKVNAALEKLLEEYGKEYPPRLKEAIRYPLEAGGKRLRPVLCLAAAELAGGGDEVMPVALSLELVHTYSLIHDDLPAMDNDDLRRGRPTVHKVFGDAMAILAGDALLTMAFEVIARSDIAPKRRVLVAEELARAAGPAGMVAGQVLDLEGEKKANGALDDVLAIHRNKTAKLITGAVRMGAIAAGGTKKLLNALTKWGENAGLAFQVADDVLDVTSTPEELGKSVGKDVTENKLTAVAVLGIDGARACADALAAKAKAAVAKIAGADVFMHMVDVFVKRSK